MQFSRTIIGTGLGLLALFGSLSFVTADDAKKELKNEVTTKKETAGGVDFRKPAQLSMEEQSSQADAKISKMEASASGIRKGLEQARKSRDVVKTLCLDDKLAQLDVAVRAARERKTSLQGAVSRKESELAGHEYAVIAVLAQRGEQIAAEAGQCIGEESSYLGQTKVSYTVDKGVAVSENGGLPDPIRGPGLTPTDPGTIIDPPQCVSCSL
jgi:hypothetical protein